MSTREKLANARQALREIHVEMQQALSTDQNPTKGDLMKVARRAAKGLEESG